jgi:hypothetical protein
LLQQKGDDLSGVRGKQYYRWWSINAAYELAPGSTRLTAQVSDLSQWVSVGGERADATAAATAGFWEAMNNLGAVGFSFGGGCFYGHGVRVSGGGARFAVTSYKLSSSSAVCEQRNVDFRNPRVSEVRRSVQCRYNGQTNICCAHYPESDD